MKLQYKNNTDSVNWERVSELFELVGWGKRNPEEIHAAFLSSSYVRFAYNGENLIGFGRTVDDGKYYGLIVDLVIDPQFQGNGVGSNILSYLEKSLKSYLFTTLTSAIGKEKFYIKQGWYSQKTSFIWPRTERQKNDYTF
jgi:aralkylamine N-acetyltransferase